MGNKLKRKAKKGKTVNIGEYTITLPAGTMIESFKKHISKAPYTTNRIADFLDAHSKRARQKIESGLSFSQREVDDMCEFYKYFMENYADDEGYVNNDIAELYEEKPYILQVIESFLDDDAASLCSLAPSPQWLTNDDEVGVQSADGVSDSHIYSLHSASRPRLSASTRLGDEPATASCHVRVQLHTGRLANKFDRGFPSVDDENCESLDDNEEIVRLSDILEN